MLDWLTQRTRASPERTALVRASTGETLDFAGLDHMVDDLAGRLHALGVGAGDHLGMVMETRLAAVCTVHAADRLGAVFVPVGHDLTPRELDARLDAADVTTLVCSERTEANAVSAFDGLVCSVDDAENDQVEPLGEVSPVDVEPAEWARDETRLLLFTSGTTGEPKVVQLTVGNIYDSAVASATRLGLHGDDRWLVCLALHHMGGLSPVLRMPLYGMTVVLRESFDAGRTADDIGSHGVTCVSLVPTMLTRMLNLRGTLADSLRVVLLGGAPAPDELIRRCRDFSVPVYPTYGMTETASQVATATPKEAFKNVGTVGRPLFGTTVTLCDDDGNEIPDGTLGELVVSGPTVSPGYYGDDGANEEAFGPAGLHTGDLGYRTEEGRLYIEGRVDDRILTGGENVHPHEVVDVLERHPQVTEAAVVGVPDDEWGERVGALVVTSDEEPTVKELDEHCREILASYKLPRVVSFTDSLPRTDSGTVDRATVREVLVSVGTVPEAESDAKEAVPIDGANMDSLAERADDETKDEQSDTPHPEHDASVASGEGATGEGTMEGTSESETEPTHIEDAEANNGRTPTDSTVFSDGTEWDPSKAVDEEADSDNADTEESEETDDADDEQPETPGFVQEALALDEQSSSGTADISAAGVEADEETEAGSDTDDEPDALDDTDTDADGEPGGSTDAETHGDGEIDGSNDTGTDADGEPENSDNADTDADDESDESDDADDDDETTTAS